MIGVGDLVVCVDAGPKPWLNPHQLATLNRISEGRMYRVRALGRVGAQSGPTIMLQGVTSVGEEFGFGWTAHRFRKVDPDQHEPCEQEFRILLNLSKRRVKSGESA